MRRGFVLNLLLYTALFAVLTPFILIIFQTTNGADTAYWRHLMATRLGAYFATSFRLVVWGSFGSLLLGVVPAWIMARYEFPAKKIAAGCMLLPLAYPSYLLAMIYGDVTSFMGPIWLWLRSQGIDVPDNQWFFAFDSWGGLLFVMSVSLSPFVYLIMYVAFSTFSAAYVDIARSVGLGRARYLHTIAIPLLLPAGVVAVFLVASALFGEYGTVAVFGERSLSVAIFDLWHVFGKMEVAAQMASGMAALILLTMIPLLLYVRRSRTHDPIATKQRHPLVAVQGITGILLASVCLLPAIFGFFVPSGTLAVWGLRFLDRTNMDQLYRDLCNSLFFAGTTCLFTLIFGVVLARAYTSSKTMGVTRFLIALANVGFFLPSTVVSVCILNLQAAHTQTFWGGFLASSLAALTFGGFFRYLFYGFASITIGIKKSHPRLADTARTYLPSSWYRLRRVYFPIIQPWLLAGAVFTFVGAFKELNLVLSLAPYNFSTLSTRIYYAVTYGTVHECALWGLVMAAISSYPLMAVANGLMRESRQQS